MNILQQDVEYLRKIGVFENPWLEIGINLQPLPKMVYIVIDYSGFCPSANIFWITAIVTTNQMACTIEDDLVVFNILVFPKTWMQFVELIVTKTQQFSVSSDICTQLCSMQSNKS